MEDDDATILTSGELWGQEIFDIKALSTYLKESWKGSPLLVSNERHVVAVRIQKNEKQKTIEAHSYDPYEGSEQENVFAVDLQKSLDSAFSEYKIEWLPHYTKHQKFTAFGECSLYASAYRSFLLKGEKPDELTDEVVLKKVASLKEMIREQHPEYFKNYDGFFQFAFDSGFAKFLLEEIKADAFAAKKPI
ncbi:MAG: hypothetical protein ACRCYZ_02500 [Alphaproteobacteria bacterium]